MKNAFGFPSIVLRAVVFAFVVLALAVVARRGTGTSDLQVQPYLMDNGVLIASQK